MEVAVFQGHRHICLLPQRYELLESNLLDLLPLNRCGVILEFVAIAMTTDSLKLGFERSSCKNEACATSLKIFLLNKCSI